MGGVLFMVRISITAMVVCFAGSVSARETQPGELGRDSAAETAASAGAGDEEARFRFGYDLGVTIGSVFGAGHGRCASGESCGTGTLLIALDFGVQFNRHVGLMLRPSFGTVGLSTMAGAHAVVEYTPIRQLSVGAGAGVEGSTLINTNPFSSYGGVSFPLLLHYNLVDQQQWEQPGRKDAWRFGLELAPGISGASSAHGFMYRASLTFGRTFM